jgi:hypothetical protein
MGGAFSDIAKAVVDTLVVSDHATARASACVSRETSALYDRFLARHEIVRAGPGPISTYARYHGIVCGATNRGIRINRRHSEKVSDHYPQDPALSIYQFEYGVLCREFHDYDVSQFQYTEWVNILGHQFFILFDACTCVMAFSVIYVNESFAIWGYHHNRFRRLRSVNPVSVECRAIVEILRQYDPEDVCRPFVTAMCAVRDSDDPAADIYERFTTAAVTFERTLQRVGR